MAYDSERFEKNNRSLRIPTGNWRFLFDVPPSRDDLLAAFDGDLLRMLDLRPVRDDKARSGNLTEVAMSLASERREVSRVAPRESKAMIGWWRGLEFVVFDATILNVGAGGSRIELGVMPPRSQPIWLCIGEPKLAELAQGRVLDVVKTPKGSYQARLFFHAPCPSAFLQAAVGG